MNDSPCFSLSKRSGMRMHICALTPSPIMVVCEKESAHQCVMYSD
jgi:hypothetical protein